MIKFRDWLEEKEKIDYFYNIEIKEIEHQIMKKKGHFDGLCEVYNIIQLNEKIILPENIKIKTNNITKLNNEFIMHKIIFHESPDELRGYYDKQKDEIHIFFDKKTDFKELEAMIGHELVHKEQHKRAGNNYFKQSENMVNKLNNLSTEINAINMMNDDSPAKFIKLKSKWDKLADEFRYLSPYECMAYAYQFVKEYKHLLPQEIITIMKEKEFPINNITKKYIGMYWLIRNKI